MDAQHSYWQVQKANEPVYPDLIWSRPENRNQAGRLLIVGGNVHSFKVPAKAYELVTKAGVGEVRVALPDSLAKSLGTSIPDTVFCPSTPSGSFGKQSLAELIDYASQADLTMLAGDFGRNSETAILIERFIEEYKNSLSVTKDALDYFTANPAKLINRSGTLIVGTIAQLQKMTIKASPDNLIKFSMSLIQLVEKLHNLTTQYPIALITLHDETILVAYRGQVSTTSLKTSLEHWRVLIASYASVWWLQNGSSPFSALTTAVHEGIYNT